MPRQVWNDGQEIIQQDLSQVSAELERELYDRVIYELTRRQTQLCFGDSFIVSNTNSTTSSVKLGNGVYYDNTQVDPEPMHRLLYLAANAPITHAAADPSHNRIDVIYITPGRATAVTATRNFKDAGSGNVSPQSMVVETDWVSTVGVVAGTPSASPAIPSTPAGSIALAQVLVTASTGISGASAYTDVRPVFQNEASWMGYKAVTSAYTATLADHVISANATGGAFAITLPSAASANFNSRAKNLRIVKSDSSANAVTITAAGSDLIVGQATQGLLGQYDSVELWSDGSVWFIA